MKLIEQQEADRRAQQNASQLATRAAMEARAAENERQMQLGQQRLVEMQRSHPVPAIDKRIWATRRRKCQSSKALHQAIFRSKLLWWDHLPSQQVLARGTKRTQAVPIPDQAICDLCTLKVEGSTWHFARGVYWSGECGGGGAPVGGQDATGAGWG